MSFQKAADLLKSHKHIVAFTGAGISTPSGIPDFRSPETGLWDKIDPDEMPTLSKFKIDPEGFYDSFKPILKQILDAKPNPAHKALAQIEKKGMLKSIITQNIDMLHLSAGSKNIINLHGTLKTGTCLNCYHKIVFVVFLEIFLRTGNIPLCEKCAAIIKPDIILFEEQLPYQEWQDAQSEIKKCDLLLVIGSSLETFPAGNLPYQTIKSRKKVIVINQTETFIDADAELVIREDVSIALPHILSLL